MALTLSKVMARAWEELGHLTELQATGGSTTTVISTYSPFTADDSLLNGTAIVRYDSAGAGAAPEGEMSVISDYVASTTTWTIGALTTAVASGDIVGLCKPTIRMRQMWRAVNSALANLGTISLVDTSLTTVSGQTEYAIPVDLKIKKLSDVLISTNDTSGNRYYESVKGYINEFPAAPASTGLLDFKVELNSGETLKLVYEGIHPALTAYNSTISETIQEELIVTATVEKALTWLVSKRGESAIGSFLLQRLNDARVTLQNQKFEKPITKAGNKPKFFMGAADA